MYLCVSVFVISSLHVCMEPQLFVRYAFCSNRASLISSGISEYKFSMSLEVCSNPVTSPYINSDRKAVICIFVIQGESSRTESPTYRLALIPTAVNLS